MPLDKGNKRVTFRSGNFHQKTSHRDHDSGVGSSSSTEQASVEGRPDRVFTDQDRQSQRFSLAALQEALDDTKSTVEKYKGKCRDLDQQLSESNKKRKQVEGLHREQCDTSERLGEENCQLRQQIDAMSLELQEVKNDRDKWRDGYLDVTDPVADPLAGAHMMTAVGSSNSSDGAGRTKSRSKHEGKEVEDRLRVRINKNVTDTEPSSSKSHHRHGSHSSSKKSRGRSSSRSMSTHEPYIEEPPDRSRPPVTTRGHYTTSTPVLTVRTSRLESPTMSPVLRTPNPLVSRSPMGSYQTTGDYNPQPLPLDPRKYGSGRRNP
jgi:hypothetical protein